MSIWMPMEKGKTPELEDHSYERTLIGGDCIGSEKLVIWIEGTNIDFDPHDKDFGICGGAIGTNCGIELSKKELGRIYRAMKRGAKLKIAACNYINFHKMKKDFEESNNMIKTGLNQFSPRKK
jgi:hypothetical protein